MYTKMTDTETILECIESIGYNENKSEYFLETFNSLIDCGINIGIYRKYESYILTDNASELLLNEFGILSFPLPREYPSLFNECFITDLKSSLKE